MHRYPVIAVSIQRAAPPPDQQSLAQARLDDLMLEWSFPNFWPDASDKAKQFYTRIFKPPVPPSQQPQPVAPQPAWPQPVAPPPAWPQPGMPQKSSHSFEDLLRYITEVHSVTGQIIAMMQEMGEQGQGPEPQQQQQQKRICVAHNAPPL